MLELLALALLKEQVKLYILAMKNPFIETSTKLEMTNDLLEMLNDSNLEELKPAKEEVENLKALLEELKQKEMVSNICMN